MDYGTLCSHYLEKEDPPSSNAINNLKLIDVNILKSNLNKKFRFSSLGDKFMLFDKIEDIANDNVFDLEAHNKQISIEVLDEVLTIINNYHFDNNKDNFDTLIHNLCDEIKLLKEDYQ